jgi:hypothetical protein
MARRDSTPTQEEDFSMEDVTADEASAAEAPAAESNGGAKRKKGDVPEGWETPTAFAHRLTDTLDGYSKESNPFKPQMVYGYVKNGKEFPAKINESDGRTIVEIEPALAWVNERVQKRADKAAAKAAEPTGTGGDAVV